MLIPALLSRLPRGWTDYAADRSKRIPLLRGMRGRVVASLKNVDARILSGAAAGLRFNPGPSDTRFLLGTFEPALQHILAAHLAPGDVFFDIGANVGFFSVLAAKLVGGGGAVHAFEPLPNNARRVAANAALNRFTQIRVHEVALSDCDGRAQFRISSVPTFGALSGSSIEVDGEVGSVEVRVRSLDDWMREGLAPPPKLIKLDIEGSETEFLRGARATIEQCRPVLLIELHGTNEPVAEFLEALSYSIDIVGGAEVRHAPWAALAVATPNESPRIRQLLRPICQAIESR